MKQRGSPTLRASPLSYYQAYLFLPSVYTIFAQKKAANGLRKNKPAHLEKALAYIDEWLSNHSKDDKAYYLKGLVFWKQGNWKLTIENYLKAIEINPNSPAKQAYEMVMDIINFSNPDLYNP